MQITCQYTGIIFEAASKRQKNHPRVSALLNDAAKAGGAAYNVAKERLAQAREAGMTDIDEVIRFVLTGAMQAQAVVDQRRAEHEQERKDAAKQCHYDRNAREYTNSILRDAGYRWEKTIEDEESMDFAGPNAFAATYGNRDYAVVWTLYAPDGRAVRIREAMEELATKQNYRAQRWLDEHKES